jgi:DNA-binding MarR family transcriptional regulator
MAHPNSPATLEDHLGYWLRAVSNAVSQSFARKVETKGVTVAEWVFLRALYDGEGISPSQLAARMGMTKGAISKLAERLVAKTLIVRALAALPSRRQTLTLTPTGRRLVPVLARLGDQNDQEFFACLPRNDRDRLVKSMRRIASAHGLTGAPID